MIRFRDNHRSIVIGLLSATVLFLSRDLGGTAGAVATGVTGLALAGSVFFYLSHCRDTARARYAVEVEEDFSFDEEGAAEHLKLQRKWDIVEMIFFGAIGLITGFLVSGHF